MVDLARGFAIVAVVVGHWLVGGLTIEDGQLVERSTLAEAPSLWPLTWVLMVLPVFFFVGGFSNRHSWESVRRRGSGYAAFLSRRSHRVLPPTLLYLAVLFAAAVLVATLPALGDRLPRDTVVLLTQPLWFLGVYLVVVALTPATFAAHRRWGWAFLVALLVVVALADVLRFGLGVDAVGALNFLVVWVLIHQLGYFDVDGRLGGRVALALAAGGLLAAWLLVTWGPYPARMIGVTGEDVSNVSPPNLALLALACAQIGLLELLRKPLARVTAVTWVWFGVVLVNSVILSLYLWHQTAHLIAASVLLPLGYPVPPAGSTGWWLATLGMVLASAVVLTGIVALVRPAEHRPPPPAAPGGAGRAIVAAGGFALLAVGLLILAGTAVTELARLTVVRGVLVASPLIGLVLVLLGALLLRLIRLHSRAS